MPHARKRRRREVRRVTRSEALLAVLGAWEYLASLSEVTEQEVKAAAVNYSVFTSLRSLFRALRRERRIFRDPARNVHLTTPVRVPRPIPSDRLRGLLNQACGAKDRLALVLMAVYAVRPKQVAEILLDDLDRSAGRLRIRRPNRLDHEICLGRAAEPAGWSHPSRGSSRAAPVMAAPARARVAARRSITRSLLVRFAARSTVASGRQGTSLVLGRSPSGSAEDPLLRT